MPSKTNNKTLVIFSNSNWSVFNFRASLINSFVEDGWDVTVVLIGDDYIQEIVKLKVKTARLPLERHSTKVIPNLKMLFHTYLLIYRENPSFVLSFTIKPNLFSSISCFLLRKKAVLNVTGLGRLRTLGSIQRNLLLVIYRLCLKLSYKTYFQNYLDMTELLKKEDAKNSKFSLLPGSGVDLRSFKASSRYSHSNNFNSTSKPLTFIMSSRLIRSKGVLEYCEASRTIKSNPAYCGAKFLLVGAFDNGHPEALGLEDFNQYIEEGTVEYLGYSTDIKKQLSLADCIVLPSHYGEGVPKSLIEGGAMGLAIITTTVIAKTGILEDTANGYTCGKGTVVELIDAMSTYITTPISKKQSMAIHSIKKVETNYSDEKIIDAYKDALYGGL